jgi:hypothetical protein
MRVILKRLFVLEGIAVLECLRNNEINKKASPRAGPK